MSTPKYGVVIVTYNRLDLLMECITCCLKQTIPFEKIIIVNNCSTDGTDLYLKQFESDKRFVICAQKMNLGGAGGFCEGLKVSGKLDLDWTLIIDDDAMISHDYIERCDDFLRKNPNVQACSGTVYTEGKIQQNHRRLIVSTLLHLEKNMPIHAYEKKCFRYDLATFCGLMISRKALKEIGFPKSEYFIWYDDTEYSMRLKRYGGIVNVNSAKLNHKTVLPDADERGFFERMNWKTYYGHRNRLDAVRSHCKKITEMVIVLEFILFIACGYGMQLLPGKRKQGKYVVQLMKDAMYDGRHGKLGKKDKYFPS